MQILFVTDIHANHEYLELLIQQVETADLVLVGGDLTDFGDARRAAAVLAPLRRAFPRVLAVPGNVDQPSAAELLVQEGVSLHGRGVVLEESGLGVFGVGGSNQTPFRTPLEFSEESLATLLGQGFQEVREAELRILVSHVPPSDTACDRIVTGKHVGSTAVREFLAGNDLDLCLTGHIHESVGLDEVGGVQVCNPGSFASGRYAVIQLDAAEIGCEMLQLQVSAARKAKVTVRSLGSKVGSYARHRLKARRDG